MEPNLASSMRGDTSRADRAREADACWAPGDRPWPIIVQATRASLSALLLDLAERLRDEPRAITSGTGIPPARRTS